jgi:filamentous hemagglutinin family protein
MKAPNENANMNPSRDVRPFTAWIGLTVAACSGTVAIAGPAGLSVQSGTATATATGPHLDITASQNAVLQWQSFNVGAGESVRFSQPSPGSVVWNRIQDANPSQIFGRIDANGFVVLMNPSGFHFGPDAHVDAAGLVVSTANAAPVESSAGLFWQFNGPPPRASIVNYGRITTGNGGAGGSLFLIAESIANHGSLSAPGGSVHLLAGQQVLLSQRPDGLALSAAVQLPAGTLDNTGRITADAGRIALGARVVNQDGLVQADSIREHDGVIELVASDTVRLGPASTLSARGDASTTSAGGTVTVIAGRRLEDTAGSAIDIRGGGQGGDGGHLELSAPELPAVRSAIDGTALAGSRGGRLFIDPQDIVLGNGGSGSANGGNVGSGSAPTTLNLDVNSAFTGLSQIRLQATRNIQVTAGTVWDLNASTGIGTDGSLLTLEAGNNITFANGSRLVAGEGWSISLAAGRDFATANGVRTGTGSITLSGTGTIEAGAGSVSLLAGNAVTVAGGAIRTTAGGSIGVRAVAGNISTGTRNNGFQFRPDGYFVDPDLGGISTAAGGNVSLVAGQDVVSLLPLAGGLQTDAGSGAFGAQPGNVTVQAGRDVQGHFVVRNGTGSITAGRNAGVASRLLALSLVDGGWTVDAGADILLQEIRNPNGLFNNLGSTTAPFRHLFDYAASAHATLTAVNSVQLRGTALPRYADAFSQGMAPIYPGTLTVSAGAGGVQLANDVTLFPSPTGNLAITTTGGGSLSGTRAGDLVQLVVSDSDRTQYRAFRDFGISDHGATPLHLNDPTPVRLDISGDLSGLLIGVPKAAEITVGGNMVNSRFSGQNLHGNDLTFIRVAGDILNRNEFTTVPVAAEPDFSPFVLDLVFPPLSGALSGIQNQFSYNAANRTLTFQGRMTGDQLQLLLGVPVRVFDAAGIPQLLPNGDPVTRNVQVLPTAVAQALYDLSQDVPQNADTGYRIGGSGQFEVTARTLDLGATAGIVSYGPRANPALARLSTHGADIRVSLTGNLEMFSTTISSLNGGDIDVHAGGHINVGSRTFTGTSATARGIFTVDASDVTVTARGDINVNGSRIAAYDGGNVVVLSLEGNVDAGSGAGGAATVEKITVDPLTGRIATYAPTIPGSGILATTFPPSLDAAFPASVSPVGNITVTTPRGNIVANAGGIVQIPLNGVSVNAGTVSLRAGTRDAQGNVVHAGNIDASGSGVIGSTVNLDASGTITGLVFARQNIDLNAQAGVNVTALAQGSVNVTSGGTISGTIIGVGSVTASGASVDASLLSQNVTASGNVTSSQVGFSQGTAASGASQSLQGDDAAKTAAKAKAEDDDARGRRVATGPRLSRTVGRVTVILPGADRPN